MFINTLTWKLLNVCKANCLVGRQDVSVYSLFNVYLLVLEKYWLISHQMSRIFLKQQQWLRQCELSEVCSVYSRTAARHLTSLPLCVCDTISRLKCVIICPCNYAHAFVVQVSSKTYKSQNVCMCMAIPVEGKNSL